MKILIIGPYGDGLLSLSYGKAFESIGHDVLWFDSVREYRDINFFPENRLIRRLIRSRLWKVLNDRIIEKVRDGKPDLILAFKAPFLHPATIRSICGDGGIPIVNYYPDNPYCGVPLNPNKTSAQRRDIVDCLREYTLVYTWSEQLVQHLNNDGVHSVYLPFGVDSFTYNPVSTNVDECYSQHHRAVFVGQRNKKRDRHLSAILKHQVTIWGPLWEKPSKNISGRHVIRKDQAFGRDCAAIYTNSDVALNIVDDLNMPGHNMKTFEIPACGGVMIATYTKEQDKFFPEGEAACYYRDPMELDNTIERLLADKDFRKRISKNALAISKDHTYIERAKELIKSLA